MKNILFIKLLYTSELQTLLHREEVRLSPMQVYQKDLSFKSLIQMIKTFRIECIDHAISDERTFSIISKEKNA